MWPMFSKVQNYVILSLLTMIAFLFMVFVIIDTLHGLWLAVLVDLFAIIGVYYCTRKVLLNIWMAGVFD